MTAATRLTPLLSLVTLALLTAAVAPASQPASAQAAPHTIITAAFQQGLAGFLALGVGDGEGAVFALALHDDAIGQLHLEAGRDHAALPDRAAGAVFLAAQGPGNGVQDRGFALAVAAADNGQTVGAGLQGQGPYTFDVFDFKLVNLHLHPHL